MYSAGNLMTAEIIQQFSSELDKKAAMNALRRQTYNPFEAHGFSLITCENKSKFLGELSQKVKSMGLQTLEDLREDLLEGQTNPKSPYRELWREKGLFKYKSDKPENHNSTTSTREALKMLDQEIQRKTPPLPFKNESIRASGPDQSTSHASNVSP